MKEKNLMIDRELSWIKFNERVLEEARSKDNPLMERMRFISIFQSNYEEFFRVRVGSIIDQYLIESDETDEFAGKAKKKQLKNIFNATKALLPRLDTAFDEILYDGRRYFTKVTEQTVTNAEKVLLRQIFEKEVAPFISPFIIEKKHPFPFFDNGVTVVGVTLQKKNGGSKFGLMPIRKSLPRAVFLPSGNCRFMLMEDLILMFTDLIFKKFVITEKIVFSVIRNADIDVNEGLYDFDIDFRSTMSRLIELRGSLAPVELKYRGENCEKILKHLRHNLCLSKKQLFYQKTPINMGFFSLLEKQLPKEKHPKLYYKPLSPQYPSNIKKGSIINSIRKKDLLLCYPFDDVKALIDLLEEAAADKRVTEIKISLYRLASNSKIVQALIAAAKNGKKVTCLVELRARFDEENNIDWSKILEESGCKIIYGMPNYKVHCKLLLISFKDGTNDIVQVGTGNFNESTARLYTDLALFTANKDISDDAKEVFRCLQENKFVEGCKELLVAPLCLKTKLISLIDEEIEKAEKGIPAAITLKLNSLTDKDLIEKLIEASTAGVPIKMVIRGICCLVPGIEGKTDNIEVRSIVGRLLEHSRIYIFGTGKDRKYYISSADFMTRNTSQRVEVATPVYDYRAKMRLNKIMKLALTDNQKSRLMDSNANYHHIVPSPNAKPHNSQLELFEDAYKNNGKTLNIQGKKSKAEKTAKSSAKSKSLKAAVKNAGNEK